MHFFAICTEGKGNVIYRLDVSRPVQNELDESFEQQAREFLDSEIERVPFASLYSVDCTELFIIKDYALAAEILAAVKNPASLNPLKLSKSQPPQIKAICAAKADGGKKISIYFQSFKSPRLLVNGFTLLLSGGTFTRLQDGGLTLDNKLAAVFEEGDLLFRSLAGVAPFLDLTTYYQEATDKEIESVLSNDLFRVGDHDGVTKHVDKQMRKSFWVIEQSGILDNLNAARCVKEAKKFDLDLTTSGTGPKKKVNFPDEKKEQKNLLKLLTEGLFLGVLTGKPYKSNSHRPLAGGSNSAPRPRRTSKK